MSRQTSTPYVPSEKLPDYAARPTSAAMETKTIKSQVLDWMFPRPNPPWTHQGRRVERYYANLNTHTLLSKMRAERKSFKEYYDQDKIDAWQRLFEERAIVSERTGSKVWTCAIFHLYIAGRCGYNDKHLTNILWRKFYYTARCPFADAIAVSDTQQVDLIDFLDAAQALGTYHGDYNYSLISDFEHRRRLAWECFFTMSTPVVERGPIIEGAWMPRDQVDTLASIVSTQLPLPHKARVLPHQVRRHVRPRVAQIFGACTQRRTQNYEIPYLEMLALLTTVLRVVKELLYPLRCFRGSSHVHCCYEEEYRVTRYRPWLDSGNGQTQEAVARAILTAGGIHEGHSVTFDEYLQFSEHFFHDAGLGRSKYNWAFGVELDNLWRGILDVPSVYRELPSQRPQPLLLQALRLLCPFNDDRARSLLDFRCEGGPSLTSDLRAAFSTLFYSKLVVIRGTTEDITLVDQGDESANTPQFAMMAIVTATPLLTDRRDSISDYAVGNEHLIYQLAPQARILRFTAAQTHYKDLVDVADDSISFGKATDTLPGLIINLSDFDSTVVMSSEGCNYEQLDIGLAQASMQTRRTSSETWEPLEPGPLKALDNAQPWTAKLRLTDIAIYDLPGYAAEDRVQLERCYAKRHEEEG